MFQNFDEVAEQADTAASVQALRRALQSRQLDGLLVPHSDEYQNEFLPPQSERLRWLTGFSGSAGAAIVLHDAAALFVDGRYVLQARKQVDRSIFEILKTPEAKPSQWIASRLAEGATLGYDPRLHTVKEIERLSETLAKSGIRLAPVEPNPLDQLWEDRPRPCSTPVVPQPLEFAGRSAQEKINELQAGLAKEKIDAVLLTQLDSIAWLFNIRGGDTPHTPLVLAVALVHADGKPLLFLDPAKVNDTMRGHFGEIAEILDPALLQAKLTELGKQAARVQLDPEAAPVRFAQILQQAGAKLVPGRDPCLLPKAIKNAAEIEGARAAHLRDGAALVRFLAWLDAELPSHPIDEVEAAIKLESFRGETGALKELSFDSISAAGPNGAIVHYRPMRRTARKLNGAGLYLIDSGGQYADGTTDVTRTVAIDAPTAEMRRHYTLVLKGHIAIASARFPRGTRGQDLDPFARRPFWEAGLDFDHGTGHGIGSYLAVHEGPQRLSRLGTVELEPGMILSNEPGLYLEGQYGIRLENLVLVTPPHPIEGGTREMLGFETLTLAPFDRRLIDASLLLPPERAWLDAYHAEVREKLKPLLSGSEGAWLGQSTALISD